MRHRTGLCDGCHSSPEGGEWFHVRVGRGDEWRQTVLVDYKLCRSCYRVRLRRLLEVAEAELQRTAREQKAREQSLALHPSNPDSPVHRKKETDR